MVEAYGAAVVVAGKCEDLGGQLAVLAVVVTAAGPLHVLVVDAAGLQVIEEFQHVVSIAVMDWDFASER